MPSAKQAYSELVLEVIADLERGVIPWRKPWVELRPANLISRRPYRGLNSLQLSRRAAQRGYASRFWLTAAQAGKHGGRLRRGEEARPVAACVMRWKQYRKRLPDSTFETRWGFIGRSFDLYNVEQTVGLDRLLPNDRNLLLFGAGSEAEKIVAAWKDAPPCDVHPSRAFYSPVRDRICMPPREAFDEEAEYFATLFHEMIHATGHRSRLARLSLPDRDPTFGSPDYAFEELVAELGAKFLCAEAGIANQCAQNNSAYIASWLGTLRFDRRRLFVAATQAEAACDFVMGRKKPVQADAAEEQLEVETHWLPGRDSRALDGRTWGLEAAA